MGALRRTTPPDWRVADVYLDQDVSLELIARLRAAGHNAVSARDLGFGQAYDYVQMLVAWERGAVFVTHNRDHFVEQVEAWHVWPQRWGLTGPSHPGVIVTDQCPPSIYAPPLIAFLAAGHPTTSQIYLWRVRGGWQTRDLGGRWRPFP